MWVVPFHEGDLLLLMTDGFADARDATGGHYPLVARIRALFGEGRLEDADPVAAVERLGDDLMRHVGLLGLTDDALVLALARATDPPEPHHAP